MGKKALKDAIDYYFLRMRLGIAFYSKTKYIPAAEHFRKAIDFNSQDPVAWEYLYSSYVLANRSNEALSIVREMPVDLQKKFQEKKKLVEMISLEGGPTFSSDNKKQNTVDIMNAGQHGGPSGEQDLYGNSYYGHLGLVMNLTNNVNLKVAYNYLNFSKTIYFQDTQYENKLDSTIYYPYGYRNFYHSSPSLYSAELSYHVRQQELHLESDIMLGSGFRLEPAVHLIMVKYNNIKLHYDIPKKIIDTTYYDSITPVINTITVQKENYSIVQSDTSFINYVFSLGISKDFKVYNIRLNGSYSNLNHTGVSSKKHRQIG
jgi:tetratricopeptide (TPR) repeat protein